MPDFIKTLNAELHEQFVSLQTRLTILRERATEETIEARDMMQKQLRDIDHRLDTGRGQLTTAVHDIDHWADEKKETVEKWREQRHCAKLDGRAKNSEKYARAQMHFAINAMQKAEKAMVQSALAKADARDAHHEEAA